MNTGRTGASAPGPSPCGTFMSSTMIVMMIAMTPSLNASSLFLFILVRVTTERNRQHSSNRRYKLQSELQLEPLLASVCRVITFRLGPSQLRMLHCLGRPPPNTPQSVAVGCRWQHGSAEPFVDGDVALACSGEWLTRP